MTGRENIYLNGTILGMKKEEIRRKFDEIVSFADIGDFIDAPVCTYSSGMHMRLGFSIAVHSLPDILLADEVLAVGDLPFALKSYRKISQFRQNGGAILLVSHSLQLIRNSCQKATWLENGSIRMTGTVNEVCDEYETKMMRNDASQTAIDEGSGTRISNDPLAQITHVETLDETGGTSAEFLMGSPFRARIHFECKRTVVRPLFMFAILTAEKLVAVSNYSNFDGVQPESVGGSGFVDFAVDKLSLKQGTYFISVSFHDNGDPTSLLDWHELKYRFTVVRNGPVSYGLLNPWPTWKYSVLSRGY
jgi:ABC-type glutathione transport system ATPase component